MSRGTQDFLVERCEACGRKHSLTITFTPLIVTMNWPNPEPMAVSVQYCCPVNHETTNYSVTFDGPVEEVEIIWVTLDGNRESVFQYGSNCSAERLNGKDRLGGQASVLGAAQTIEDYRIAFDVWSDGNNCAAANLVRSPGTRVWGVLYEISNDFIWGKRKDKRKTLEQIEGQRYRSTMVRVRDVQGREQEATTFMANERDRQADILTSTAYVSWIVKGLRDQGVPEDYLREVKQIAAANNPAVEKQVEDL